MRRRLLAAGPIARLSPAIPAGRPAGRANRRPRAEAPRVLSRRALRPGARHRARVVGARLSRADRRPAVPTLRLKGYFRRPREHHQTTASRRWSRRSVAPRSGVNYPGLRVGGRRAITPGEPRRRQRGRSCGRSRNPRSRQARASFSPDDLESWQYLRRRDLHPGPADHRVPRSAGRGTSAARCSPSPRSAKPQGAGPGRDLGRDGLRTRLGQHQARGRRPARDAVDPPSDEAVRRPPARQARPSSSHDAAGEARLRTCNEARSASNSAVARGAPRRGRRRCTCLLGPPARPGIRPSQVWRPADADLNRNAGTSSTWSRCRSSRRRRRARDIAANRCAVTGEP